MGVFVSEIIFFWTSGSHTISEGRMGSQVPVALNDTKRVEDHPGVCYSLDVDCFSMASTGTTKVSEGILNLNRN